MRKVIVIAGPTAVGKSDFAVEIAEKYDMEIISGDSIQVYRGLSIGSGKVTEEEMHGVRHHLIDILDPKDSYSAADFQAMARNLIDHSDRGMIICGGTGLYLKACLYDYVFDQEEESCSVDPQLELLDNQTLYDLLRESDPVQAQKIHVNNRRRLLRSLTIQRRTGKPQSELEKEQEHRMIYDARIIGCTMQREMLYDRINRRVEKMVEHGLKQEIQCLLDQGVTFVDQSMQGIGYKEWKPYFEGTALETEVIAEIQKHSRQFAKRQYTWLNHQMPVEWCDMTDAHQKQAVMDEIGDWYTKQEK
ncbi:MAG: tRNA (adenosine(37)-N6)-dimethylallyltransferase MiaA [Bulleidia sp.]